MAVRVWIALLVTMLGLAGYGQAQTPYKVLIVDGQNNHKWKETTPILKKHLEDTGLFQVDVATTPAGRDLSGFHPKFSDYQVVVSNYNGAPWPAETRQAFVEYIRKGGGLVCVHAADNSFPDWPEYNEMIGLGGWGGRNEKSGPYIRIRDGKIVRDTSPGNGGSHGKMHDFVVEIRDPQHPIVAGLPNKWLHVRDELYDRLRGPAKNLTLLATAHADRKTGGSGEDEPMLFTTSFGEGRVFHTTLGHDAPAMKCVGFTVTFTRGVEWAASGKVTQKIPSDFPTAEKTSSRP